MTQVKMLAGNFCRSHLGRVKAISGYTVFFTNNFWLKRDTDVRLVSLRFSHRDTSDDIQQDLLRWALDLDLLRSKRICSDASRREKYDGVSADSLSFLVQKLFTKKMIYAIWSSMIFLFTSFPSCNGPTGQWSDAVQWSDHCRTGRGNWAPS